MTSNAFVNSHLSYSRLSRFEQCPLSFKLHYIDKKEPRPGVPLLFGKSVHAVLEDLLNEHVADERHAALDKDRALALWKSHWEKNELYGLDVFEEGVEIIGDFVRRQGVVDHLDVLAIEQEFRLPVGPFTVLGYIDRVNRVDDVTVEIEDYKTNRVLFSREDVDHSLQLSLYQLAAQRLWPWAKRFRLVFNMLRHNVRMVTERTPEQLQAALDYVESLGRMTERASSYPARLNTNCSYCDHRHSCEAYKKALLGEKGYECRDLTDITSVAKEREEVARITKILNGRKKELEGIIKARIDSDGELVLGGVRYRMFNSSKQTYPLGRTLEVLSRLSGMSQDEIVAKVAVIDGKAVDQLLKDLSSQLAKPRHTLLKAELGAVVEKSFSPRFWAKAVSK